MALERWDETAGAPASPPVAAAKSLTGNAFWAVLGNVCYAGGRFGIVVLLAKAFSSEQVGQVLFALAVVTPLSFLMNLELRSVYVTDAAGWVRPGHCLASRLVTNALFAAVLAGMCLWNRGEWSAGKMAALGLVGGVRMMESWADVYLGVLQKHERMKNWAMSQGMKTAGVLAWALVVAVFLERIEWFLAGWLVVTAGVLWWYDRRRAGALEAVALVWEGAAARRLMWYGLALGVFVAMASANQYVGQYFIESAMGDAAVAYFAVLMSLVSGLAAVQNGVNQAVLPRLARYFATDVRRFWALLGRVLVLAWAALAVLVVLVWWRGEWILRVLYAPEYAEHADVFVVVMGAGALVLTGMALGDAVIACHWFKSRTAAVGLGLGVNAGLCWLLVGRWGLAGAAWAAAASGAVICVYCAGVLWKATQRQAGEHSSEDVDGGAEA